MSHNLALVFYERKSEAFKKKRNFTSKAKTTTLRKRYNEIHISPLTYKCYISVQKYLESTHDEGNDDIPLLLRHLGGDGQQHQHVVALGHSHGVQVGQYVGTRDLTLYTEVLFNTCSYVGAR